MNTKLFDVSNGNLIATTPSRNIFWKLIKPLWDSQTEEQEFPKEECTGHTSQNNFKEKTQIKINDNIIR